MSEGLIIIQYCTDLVGLTMGSDSAEVFGQVFEGLVVVLWQCVQQALQLQHALLWVRVPVGFNERVIEICTSTKTKSSLLQTLLKVTAD